jgi:hypothetical protein
VIVSPVPSVAYCARGEETRASPRPEPTRQLIVEIATGEAENVKPTAPREAQRKGGLKGGKARAKALSKTLRVTPAMEAGVSDHVWGLDEIARLAA